METDYAVEQPSVALAPQVEAVNKLSLFFGRIEAQVAKLVPVDWEAILAHKITSKAEQTQASEYKRQIKKHMDGVSEILDEPTKIAYDLHRSFTGLRNTLTADDQAALAHLVNQNNAFVAEEDRKRLELEQELQRQATERAKEEAKLAAERAEAERLEREANLMPWELAEPEPEPITPVVVREYAPIKIELADSNADSKANKPWTYELTDIKALCKAIADGLVKIDPDNPAVILNPKFFSAAAKFHQDKLAEHFPGVKGVRPTRNKL